MTEYFNPASKFQGIFMPSWLMKRTGLNAGSKLLYAVLAKYAHGSGEAWPEQKSLAEDCGVEARSIRNHIKELVDAGLIEVEQRGLRKSNIYRFVWHDWMQDELRNVGAEKISGQEEKGGDLERKTFPVKDEATEEKFSGQENSSQENISAQDESSEENISGQERKTLPFKGGKLFRSGEENFSVPLEVDKYEVIKGEVIERESAGARDFAFDGEVIKVDQATLDRWKETYPDIPDLIVALVGLDSWCQRKAITTDWLPKVETVLATKNAESKKKPKPGRKGGKASAATEPPPVDLSQLPRDAAKVALRFMAIRSPAEYRNWIGKLRFIGIIDGEACYETQVAFTKSQVESQYLGDLRSLWQEVDPAVASVRISMPEPTPRGPAAPSYQSSGQFEAATQEIL